MNLLFFIFFFCISSLTSAVYVTGVAKNKQSLYTKSEENPTTFVCLDGLKSIPFDLVNDNYCDCVDGSDEPGTSACSNFHFYCQNRGYISFSIPSSRVNDGICDCCDGSDEKGICEDTCKTLASQFQQNTIDEKLKYENGLRMHQQYEIEGIELMKTVKQEVEDLKKQLEQYKTELETAQKVKAEEEATENKEREASQHSGEWEVKRNDLISKLKLSELSQDQLISVILKLAEKANTTKDIQPIVNSLLGQDNEIVEINVEDYLMPPTYIRSEAELARQELIDVEKKISDVESKIKTKSDSDEIALEDNPALYLQRSKCYSGRQGKYNYEHCILKKVTQDGTLLGIFDRMEGNVYYYKDGSSCWNGPNRSCKVTMECGEENTVIDVSEPSTCVYEMKFRSPLACSQSKPSYFDPQLCEDGCEL